MQNRILLLDESREVYMPLRFACNFDMTDWHVKVEDVDVLRTGPNHEQYWDVWDKVLQYAYFVDAKGFKYILEPDDDLFASIVK